MPPLKKNGGGIFFIKREPFVANRNERNFNYITPFKKNQVVNITKNFYFIFPNVVYFDTCNLRRKCYNNNCQEAEGVSVRCAGA